MKQRKTSGVTIQNFISEKPKILSHHYTDITKIASANFGDIFTCRHLPTNTLRCLKTYSKEKLKTTNQNKFEEEVALISSFDHPNIFKIYEFYQDKKTFYLISEYLKGGELFNYITQGGDTSEKTVCVIMEQVLSAVNYLHAHDVLHRDLKPENIMLAQKGDIHSIKLIDFGTSKYFDRNEKMTAPIGTCYYMAPEMIKRAYDERVDIWACGVIMYILLVGYPPFNGRTDIDIFKSILHKPLIFDRDDWANITPGAINIIMGMLEKDPNIRINLSTIFKHNWFKRNFNIKARNGKNVLKRLKSFSSNTKLENAIRIFLIQCYDINEEQEQLLKFFKEADRNHDGMLDTEEIKAICKEQNFSLDTKEFLKSADVNGDGKVNYSEFLMAAVDFKKKSGKKMVIDIFKSIDADNDGYVDRRELSRFLNLSYNDPLIEELFEEADINKDNRLTIDEFLTDLVNLYS